MSETTEPPEAPESLSESQQAAIRNSDPEQSDQPPVTSTSISPAAHDLDDVDSRTHMQMVYALGILDYDLVSEARRDSYAQAIGADPNNHEYMRAHLAKNPHEASGIIWTLNLDATPIYAVQPAGPFAEHVYDELRRCLEEQDVEGVQRVSMPGIVA